ncbi:MAG: FHA domain-containing protein, partial [Longimicrobiales bacterium]
MADSMIVEVRDLRGRLVTRHPVVGSQIRVGRAFDNDVILDDPHADAHHAVLDLNLAGRSVRVSDLGSLNGTRLGRRPATAEGDEWPFGAPIEIGRTTITFFAADTPVPQATPLQSKLVRRVSASPARSLALSAAVALYVMVTTWFTDYQENGWVSWGGAALGILFVLYL